MIANQFQNKIILVTGAARGIGHAIANAFHSQGATVWSADIIDPANKIQGVNYEKVNLEDENQIKSLMEKIGEKLDVLINNAAFIKMTDIRNIQIDEFDKVFAVNLRAPFILSKLAIPKFEKAGRGNIINISSTRSLMSEANNEAYTSTKSGLNGLTHALANSLGPLVRVNSICPGWIECGDYQSLKEEDHSQHPVGRVGKPDDIANACLFLADDSKSGFITGQKFVIDGGMTVKMIYNE
ncbi:hypothetical protein ABPG72_014606 [Tetrahymena utriculariae]